MDPRDPAAIASRRDLRGLHAVMGNARWVVRQADCLPAGQAVVEIGAGDGALAARLARRHRVTALDRVPAPAGLTGVDWRSGDLFARLPEISADVVVAVMVLHHFSDEALRDIGRHCARAGRVIFCEPWRSSLALAWSALAWPLVSRVTRHDMPVSIRAGFRAGELAPLLGLEAWTIEESVDLRGALRLVAWRK